MVYTEPNSVCYLTPIDTKSLSPNEFFSAKEDDRFGFRLTSNLFDERYSVISKGFFPEYSPATSEHTFKRELDGYSLKDVFSSEYHASIGYIVALNAGNTPYSDYPYGDLSNNVVENSLNPDILQAFNDIKALSGKSLKSEFINAVAKLLIRDELKYFNRSYIKSLAGYLKEVVGDSYLSNKKTKNQNAALDIVEKSAVNLDRTYHNKDIKDALRYWRTLPGDVSKRLQVLSVDGTENSVFISTDDTLHVEDISKDTRKVFYGPGDFLPVDESEVELTADISNAKVLNLVDSEKIFNLLGVQNRGSLKVVTAESDSIELSPTPNAARAAYTVLKLDPESVVDQEGSSPLIRITQATYNIATNIDEDLQTKAFPNAVLYVLNDDTILDYLNNKEQAILTFNDLNFSFFTNATDNIVRVIPQHIVIVPTDKTEYVPFHSRSRMSTYGTRSLDFVLHPDRRKQVSNITSPKHLTYTKGTNKYSFRAAAFTQSDYYRKYTEQLPRKTSSIYKSLLVLRSLLSNYGTLPERVPFFELFYRMSPSELQSLSLDLQNFNNYKYKLMLQKLSSVTSVAETYPKLGESFRTRQATTLLSYAGVTETYPILTPYKHLITMKYPTIFEEGY